MTILLLNCPNFFSDSLNLVVIIPLLVDISALVVVRLVLEILPLMWILLNPLPGVPNFLHDM